MATILTRRNDAGKVIGYKLINGHWWQSFSRLQYAEECAIRLGLEYVIK